MLNNIKISVSNKFSSDPTGFSFFLLICFWGRKMVRDTKRAMVRNHKLRSYIKWEILSVAWKLKMSSCILYRKNREQTCLPFLDQQCPVRNCCIYSGCGNMSKLVMIRLEHSKSKLHVNFGSINQRRRKMFMWGKY